MKFLDVHSKLTDCAIMAWYIALQMDGVVDLADIGGSVVRFRQAVSDASALIKSCPQALQMLPLRYSMHYYDQWLKACEVVVDLYTNKLLEKSRNAMDLARKQVEEASPSWGVSINEEKLDLQMAKLQLVESDTVRRLPELVKSLHRQMVETNKVCLSLGLPSSTECSSTRDRTLLATNALDFAKQTVSVAAALTVALANNKPGIEKVLQHRDQLPKRLVAHLLSLAQKDDEDEGEGSGVAASSLKRLASAAGFDRSRPAPSPTAATSSAASVASRKGPSGKQRRKVKTT